MEKPASIHDAYVDHGTRGYYQQFGAEYRNPHEAIVFDLLQAVAREWPVDLTNVLDLAAGSGEVTLALHSSAQAIAAIDPFTAVAYEGRTGQACEKMTFEAIAAGGLQGRRYSLIVCSFAMHLVEPSRLPTLCWALAEVTGQLLILTPHKRPDLEPAWGWGLTHERLLDRVRARLYAVQPAAKGLS